MKNRKCSTLFLIGVLLFIGISGKAQDFLLSTTDGLPDLGNGAVVWADFNNDGRLDVAITGNNTSTKEAGLYINNINGTFSNSGVALTPVSNGSLDATDYNNDGLMDLLLAGSDASNVKVTKVYKNLGSNIFASLSTSFEGVAFGSASFINLTNDGKPDIIVCGLNNANARICVVYRNDGNDVFSLASTGIAGASNGSLLVTDFNNDSYDDVLITGLNSGNSRVNRLYTNKQDGTFQLTGTVLPLLRSGGIATADVNADGFTDILLSGNDSGGSNMAKVYTNNAGSGFVLLKTLAPVVDGGGAFGDFNSDGLSDLALFGFNNPDLKALVYNNAAGADFIDPGTIFPGTSNGSFNWADYNNDNKLDLLLNGYPASASNVFTNLYTNNTAGTNTNPGVPSNLTFTSYADSVVLKWDAPTDNETSSSGLTYDIYVGSSVGATDIVSPLSDKANGKRKVAAAGRIHGRTFTLKGLPEGAYYWSVQAVDPSFAGSAFATEATFASCNKVFITGTNAVCYNTAINLNVGNSNDVVEWYSVKNTLTAIGASSNLAITITAKDTLYAKVTKPLGCVVYDTTIVNITPLPAVSLGSDRTACLDKVISLEAVTTVASVRWYAKDQPSATLGTNTTLQIQINRDTTIVAEVTDINQCVNRDSVAVTLLAQPTANLGVDIEICFNAQAHFTAGAAADSVNWFSQKNGLMLRASRNYQFLAREDDNIRVEVFNTQGCVDRDSVSIKIISLPSADAGPNKLICNNQRVTIGTESTAPGLRYLWEPSSSLNSATISAPLAGPASDTQYVLHVFNVNNCENRDTVIVYLNQTSTISTGGNKVICIGGNVTLGGNPTAMGSNLPYSFHWFPATGLDNMAKSNPQASPTLTTVYGLQTKAGDCVIDTSYVTVRVNPLPVISAGDDVIAGKDETVTLHAQGGSRYVWFPEELFDDNKASDPVVFPNRTTTYILRGTDTNGCQATDTVKVILRSELFVPSLFTPNGDGSNDYFRVHGFGIENIMLKVYDRWGRLLFTTDQLETGWDGLINGNEAEPGNYVWTVEGSYYDSKPLNFNGQNTGTFKLLR